MLDTNIFIEWVQNNKDWLFDGIGVTILIAIGGLCKKFVFKSKSAETDAVLERDNVTGSILGDSNVVGNGNIVGDGNINANVVNVYGKEYKKEEVNSSQSWFANRFFKIMELLNDARGFQENEYTIEYISALVGLNNVGQLKQYLNSDSEPDDDFKRRFVEVFGVNNDWMLYGRGDFPFFSNIENSYYNPMDILRNEDLKEIDSFIVVTGLYEKRRHACIIRKNSKFCYEVYCKKYILHSDVGNSGKHSLIEFYRFIREADKIKKLDMCIYEATEKQFLDLCNGSIAPKKVKKFKVICGFISNFLDLSSESIELNARLWDEDLIEVQKLIKEDLEEIDKINQESDKILINKNLGKVFVEEQEGNFSEKIVEEKSITTKRDIDSYDNSTTFFDYRFAKAFPGVRGIQEFVDPKECVDRLEILLRKPLNKKGLTSPIWWFRGSSNLHIREFFRISESKFLMNRDEIEINRIVVYGAPEYYKKFVYVEAKPEKSIGLYESVTEEHIEEYRKSYGEYHEEYAVYNGIPITRAEYDDDAAVIDGKVVDLENKAELRVRYLTPYNFIICAQFNPINETKNDAVLKRYLNGVLEGKYRVEHIVEFVDSLGRHRNDM